MLRMYSIDRGLGLDLGIADLFFSREKLLVSAIEGFLGFFLQGFFTSLVFFMLAV